MSYTDINIIEKRFPRENIGQLTDDEGSDDVVDEVVAEVIKAADGEINALLTGRYPVPLATVPDIIVNCSTEIFIYLLHQRYVDEIPDTWQKAYDRRMKYLTKISEGKADLPITEAGSDDFVISAVTTSHFKG